MSVAIPDAPAACTGAGFALGYDEGHFVGLALRPARRVELGEWQADRWVRYVRESIPIGTEWPSARLELEWDGRDQLRLCTGGRTLFEHRLPHASLVGRCGLFVLREEGQALRERGRLRRAARRAVTAVGPSGLAARAPPLGGARPDRASGGGARTPW